MNTISQIKLNSHLLICAVKYFCLQTKSLYCVVVAMYVCLSRIQAMSDTFE